MALSLAFVLERGDSESACESEIGRDFPAEAVVILRRWSGLGDTGTVFSLDKNQNETVLYSFCVQTSCSDGANPVGGLLNINGTLYGTTQFGGLNSGDGTVFAINHKTGAETVVYTFCQTDCSDGDEPAAGLIVVLGTLYGTTEFGGTPGKGTVFAIKKPY